MRPRSRRAKSIDHRPHGADENFRQERRAVRLHRDGLAAIWKWSGKRAIQLIGEATSMEYFIAKRFIDDPERNYVTLARAAQLTRL